MPVDMPTLSPSLARSLGGNQIGDKGASALAAILKETRITKLLCAAARVFAFVSMPVDMPALSPFPPYPSLTVSTATTSEPRAPPRSPPSSRQRRSLTWSAPPPECSLSCQRPLTCLLSHHSHPTPRSQSLQQQHRSRGRLRARRHPQGDAAHQLRVRRRPSVRFCVNATDTPDLCSAPRSQSGDQRHRRRGCHQARCRPQRDKDHRPEVRPSSNRLPIVFANVSAPIDTPILSHHPHPTPLARSLNSNNIGERGASALAAILKETQITSLGCAAARVFAFVSMPVDTRLLSHCPHPSLAVSSSMALETRAPLHSPPSSARRRSQT